MVATKLSATIQQSRLPWILTIVLLFGLCFSDKPYHIDDVYFLEVATNILETPFDPFHGATSLIDDDYRAFSETGRTPNTFEAMSHPPLVPYFQAGVVAILDTFREREMHLVFIIFPLVCVVSTYFLAKRFTPYPVAATLFLASSPLFLVNSTNVMTDIPMLSLGLSALCCFITGMDQENRRWLLFAGILAGLAMLTRYVAVGLIPLFWCYAFLHKKKLKYLIYSLAPAIALFGIWSVENWIYHGSAHLISSSRHYISFYQNFNSFDLSTIFHKMLSGLAAIGGTGMFALLFLVTVRSDKKSVIILCISFFLAVCLMLLTTTVSLQLLNSYSRLQLAMLSFCLTAGLFLCFGAVLNPSKFSPDQNFLMLWLFGSLATSIIILPFGTGRYMLPVVPALIFYAASTIRIPSSRLAFSKITAGAAIMGSFILSVILTILDYQHATAYKQFSLTSQSSFAESRIWFDCDWGCRYYMKQNGHQYLLSTDDSPIAGDIVIKAETAGLHTISPSLSSRCSLIQVVPASSNLPVRLMNAEAKAGFYSHGFGLLPFGFSNAPLETFHIYRVENESPGQTEMD